MRFGTSGVSAWAALLVGTATVASGNVIANITSDCTPGSGCISITYSGAPGSSPAGNAVKLVSPDYPTWGKLSDFGLTGDWISYGQTGGFDSGSVLGHVDFTLNYALNPAWSVDAVVFNVMADDFAQITASPENFGPLPPWDAELASVCSSTHPGCLDEQMYSDRLTAAQLAMFVADRQMTFSVTELVPNTPFGLAFDIQILDPATPEPGTLGLVGVAIIAGWVGLRRSGSRPQGDSNRDT
jgi:hypothetical protein